MELKLQSTNVVVPYVSHLYLFVLTYGLMQARSLSYHAESGNIIVGLDGHVEMWQTDPYNALPAHVCVRERLAEAQAQAKDIGTSIENFDSGIRQQMSREQELKCSITDLEAKCAGIYDLHTIVLTCI